MPLVVLPVGFLTDSLSVTGAGAASGEDDDLEPLDNASVDVRWIFTPDFFKIDKCQVLFQGDHNAKYNIICNLTDQNGDVIATGSDQVSINSLTFVTKNIEIDPDIDIDLVHDVRVVVVRVK